MDQQILYSFMLRKKDADSLIPSFRSTNKELTDLPPLLILVVPDSVVQFTANSNLKEFRHMLSDFAYTNQSVGQDLRT